MKLTNKIRNLNLLIKPASGSCNLRCSYCFYFDVADNREIANYGNMSYETLENIVKNAFSHSEGSVSFMFQGGEPTARGLDFFRRFHDFIELYNIEKLETFFSIQTNATLLNEDWIQFLKEKKYLVGISLDGMKEIHDIFRLDRQSQGTFDRVLDNLFKLREAGVEFNVLSVVNSEVAKHGKEIYEYFLENDFSFMQFIPALDPLKDKEKKEYSLTAENYGIFLDELFNAWYEDILQGRFSAIRYYENLLLILLGREPESCDMVGHCTANAIIEADGSVYPCDFYVLDEKRLGNINDSPISEILHSPKAVDFVKESYQLHEDCKKCCYLKLCRSGCRRHKDAHHYNKFCKSYQYFFERNIDKLIHIRDILSKGLS